MSLQLEVAVSGMSTKFFELLLDYYAYGADLKSSFQQAVQLFEASDQYDVRGLMCPSF